MVPNRPIVSILMPCFNEAVFIERAVRSVLAQDFSEPFELIVIDVETSARAIPSKSRCMSSSEEMATPERPTSPAAIAWSES